MDSPGPCHQTKCRADLSQTPVTVSCTVSFDPGMSGETFPSENSLDLFTDLENAQWVVTKTEMPEDHPEVTDPPLAKSGIRVRLDGWSLNYEHSRVKLDVRLKGTAPAVSQPQDKIIFRVQGGALMESP